MIGMPSSARSSTTLDRAAFEKMASGGFSSVCVAPASVCQCAVRKMAPCGVGQRAIKVVHNNATYFQAGHVLYDDAGTAVGNIDRKGVITMNYVEATE